MVVTVRGPADAAVAGIGPAYTAAAPTWARGPGRVYRHLAELLVGTSPVPLEGRLVLDVGAGTGAAGAAARARGARVVAVDLAVGMIAAGGAPGAVADARHLPLRDGAVGAVVAAFCLNHVDPPAAGVREARRVVAPGGAVLVSSYGHERPHPARAAVEQALAEAGHRPPAWYLDARAGPITRLASAAGMRACALEAGLPRRTLEVEEREVPLPGLSARDLVRWRLGMAHTAPFVRGLPAAARAALVARALDLLGDPPPLVRRVVLLAAAV